MPTPKIATPEFATPEFATPDIAKSRQLTYLLLRMYEGGNRKIRYFLEKRGFFLQ